MKAADIVVRVPVSWAVRLWAGILWRVAMAGLLCVAAWVLWNLPAQLHREADATRKAALSAIADTRKDLLGAVGQVRTDLFTRVDTALDKSDKDIQDALHMADARLQDLTAKVDGQLTRTNDTLAAVTPVLEHAGSVAKQIDDSAPLYLDCEFNPDCAFNRFQGTSKAIEQTAQAVAKAAPSLADSAASVGKSVAGIADDAHREADEFMKPKSFRQKVADWLGILPRLIKFVL